jgi:hypothetical protein
VFLLNALSDVLMFTLLAGAGLALRAHSAWHKRLMLMANFPPLNAALVRLVAYLHLAVGAATLRAALALLFIAVG